MPGTPGSNVTEESKHWRLGTHRIRPWMSCLACEGCCVVSLEQCSIFDPRESVFFGLVCVCVCFVLGKLDWGCVFESGIYGRVIPIENMSYYIGFWHVLTLTMLRCFLGRRVLQSSDLLLLFLCLGASTSNSNWSRLFPLILAFVCFDEWFLRCIPRKDLTLPHCTSWLCTLESPQWNGVSVW